MSFAVVAVVMLQATATLAADSTASAQSKPTFKLGFKALADQIPEVVGEPIENERHNPGNGDALQQTTTGLMVWRKADNWTAFTNGTRTWINGPAGAQSRGNHERFPWEGAPSFKAKGDFEVGAEQAALEMINQSRKQNGLSPVEMDPELREVARAHAQDMATRNYFSHNTPEGKTPLDRARDAGLSYDSILENVATGKGYSSSVQAVRVNHDGMMAETAPNDRHRQNILASTAGKVGIGVVRAGDGKVYYVADFAG